MGEPYVKDQQQLKSDATFEALRRDLKVLKWMGVLSLMASASLVLKAFFLSG